MFNDKSCHELIRDGNNHPGGNANKIVEGVINETMRNLWQGQATVE